VIGRQNITIWQKTSRFVKKRCDLLQNIAIWQKTVRFGKKPCDLAENIAIGV
jgi:hypothetical protein